MTGVLSAYNEDADNEKHDYGSLRFSFADVESECFLGYLLLSYYVPGGCNRVLRVFQKTNKLLEFQCERGGFDLKEKMRRLSGLSR